MSKLSIASAALAFSLASPVLAAEVPTCGTEVKADESKPDNQPSLPVALAAIAGGLALVGGIIYKIGGEMSGPV